MNIKDVKLSVKGKVLTVEGYREPSAKEVSILKRQLWEQKRRPGFDKFFPRDEDENHHLLRLAAGRYGSFSVSFELPVGDVLTDNIQASYVGGVLQVIVPKRVQASQPQPRGFGSPWGDWYGRGRPRNQGSFFDDTDFFW